METKPKKFNLIKKLIVELGFHFCWGKIINNENPLYTVSIEQHRKSKRVYILMHYRKNPQDTSVGGSPIYCDDVETAKDLKLLLNRNLAACKKYLQFDKLSKDELIYKLIELEKSK